MRIQALYTSGFRSLISLVYQGWISSLPQLIQLLEFNSGEPRDIHSLTTLPAQKPAEHAICISWHVAHTAEMTSYLLLTLARWAQK